MNLTIDRILLSSTSPFLLLEVDHASAAIEARRVVASIASAAGLSETGAGAAAIIVNELTTNLVKHAKDGALFISGTADHLDLIAVDRGPGLRDVSQCMKDGYSSSGTAGNGLGAVRRLASQFDIHSMPGKGTVVFARLDARANDGSPFRAGAFWRPMQMDDLCGDACVVMERGDEIVSIVADGLGHGVAAAEASRCAITVAAATASTDPVHLLERMHLALRPTRGAAVAVTVVNPSQRAVRFAGIGNIAATIRFDGETKSLVSLNGIVGHQVRSFQQFRYEWRTGSTLVMHSDGLTSRWSFDHDPALSHKEPAIIAAVLARDFARERDDRCVLVMRGPKS